MLDRLKALAATAAVRAVKTFAQTLGAMLTAAGTGLLDTDWLTSLSVAGMAALLSLLTTVGGDYLPKRDEEDGATDVGLLLLVATFVGVVLLLFGVRFD